MKPSCVLFALAVIFCGLALSRGEDPTAGATANCDPSQLSPCAVAILYSTPPSPDCCARLGAQQPCFCQYARNPSLGPYVGSGQARRVLAACSVPLPKC